LVAMAGTDIPFYDQWDVEGGWLYPAFLDGSLHFADLFRPHSEHRIVWTHLLNLLTFYANGNRWDPLVQLAVGAVLHALCAAVLVHLLTRGLRSGSRTVIVIGALLANLPVLGWHNALWGFQSSVYFVLLFATLAYALLDGSAFRSRRQYVGWVMVLFALFAMGPGLLVPVALFGLGLVRFLESGEMASDILRQYWPVLPLLALTVILRRTVPEHAVLQAGSIGQFIRVASRVMAWPHVEQPLAAFALNLPISFLLFSRIMGRRRPAHGENFVLLMGGWSVAIALATAWSRGGSDELVGGVPSRYADLIVLLPLANLWCLVTLLCESGPWRRASSQLVAGIWVLFLLVGWVGLSVQMMRGIILPRARDPLAPVRLAVAFEASVDPAVFDGQPRLLVPHPNLASVQRVLTDPRMKGALPPSLQAGQPMGPLSRAIRKVLGR